eukprot:Blabericola_migrator_1__2518@NODE_1709_length_3955_cov_614_992798_g1105_i0_p4_GENE_NODE_1709_length_3955_cov_614_992798_g1105_i0NODE_1709_length_3955_cov_614_992798_g1105_i0_p4_ORF_typecomplete_len184_score5_57_NODE_1709_length_3955_cov_614_992798_g1105_i024002951
MITIFVSRLYDLTSNVIARFQKACAHARRVLFVHLMKVISLATAALSAFAIKGENGINNPEQVCTMWGRWIGSGQTPPLWGAPVTLDIQLGNAFNLRLTAEIYDSKVLCDMTLMEPCNGISPSNHFISKSRCAVQNPGYSSPRSANYLSYALSKAVAFVDRKADLTISYNDVHATGELWLHRV